MKKERTIMNRATAKGNKSRKKKRSNGKTKIQVRISSKTYFYGLYYGYNQKGSPILFTQASHALSWSISRLIRDGITLDKNNLPDFLPFIGTVELADGSPPKFDYFATLARPSSIERKFFAGVSFHQVNDPSSISSKPNYVRINDSIFYEVLATMSDSADYHLSAGSTYKKKKIPPSTIQDVSFQHSGFLSSIKRDDSPFILLKRNALCPHMDLISTVRSYISSCKFERIIISVCAGRSETELQANKDSDLVVCLDSDCRSLCSGKLVSQYVAGRPNNVIFYPFDYSEGLSNMLRKLKCAARHLPIHLLFQHPSPSPSRESRHSLGKALRASTVSLKEEDIDSIHLVFDCNPKKNTWTGASLTTFLLASLHENRISTQAISISSVKTLCKPDHTELVHPLMGTIKKAGWAVMKKGGAEMCFSIERK